MQCEQQGGTRSQWNELPWVEGVKDCTVYFGQVGGDSWNEPEGE